MDPQLPRRIVSASRRTDLPGWHADWLAARLRGLRTPVHAVFFWTRFPRAFVRPGPLRDALRAVENPFVNLTVTGLGATPLEPRVPPTAAVLEDLPPLIAELRGQPERVRWRCDPLLAAHHSRDLLERLFAGFAALGIRTCTVSLPATQSLKGDLTAQLAAAGITPPSPTAGRELAARAAAVGAAHGVRLAACATPILDPLVSDGTLDRAQCVSAVLAASLHPRRIPLDLPKDSHQRRACTCVLSDDVGSYTDHPCGSGCGYCYSKAGGPPRVTPSADSGCVSRA